MEYFDFLLKNITESIQSIDESKFNQLVDECINVLRSGKKVIASGLGKNVSVCEKFVGTMASLGINSYFLHTNSAVHGDIGLVYEGDLVIILSKSGETSESIYLAEKLKNKNANLWLISFNKNSTLTEMIEKNIILKLEHEGDIWNIMPNNSSTINLIILQALAMCIAKNLGIKLEEFKENHPGGYIGKLLKNKSKIL